MAPSSSANKVAKLAQKGKGKKVRFQGGLLFPAIIAAVVLIFGGLIVYARESRPAPGEGEPTADQHWHAALGMYVCDENGLQTLPKLQGNLEDTDASGNLVSTGFLKTGIHSHSDGVMHWHPNSSGRATGTNAQLHVFLDNYGVVLTDTKLALPPEQSTNPEGDVFEEGKSTCKIDGVEKDAQLKLWVWDNYSDVDTTDPSVYTSNMGDVRIKNDGMVFMIAFVPEDVKPVAPEWAKQLLSLGAADGGQVPPSDNSSTTVAATPDTGTPDTSTSNTTTPAVSTPVTGAGEPSDTASTGG